jgi:hypothetical protein
VADEVYNPLDTKRLGGDVARELLGRPLSALPPPDHFFGAGIYLIYYAGPFPPYSALAKVNSQDRFAVPIYIGKAVPKGRRKGTAVLQPAGKTRALSSRLRVHARRIANSENLDLADFRCRYLVVEQVWVPLAEAILIERFHPIWNSLIDGFGNNDPGSGRYGQKLSRWDVLHPGRTWAKKLKPSAHDRAEIEKEAAAFLSKRPRDT